MPDGIRSQRGAGALSRPRGGDTGAATAVLGVADHNGWAVCVTVADGGRLPVVVDRRRIELIAPGLPSQPYHHEALGMSLAAAEALVARVRTSVMETTLARLSELRDELQRSYAIVAMTIRTPPLSYVPVTVAEAHASYPVMCRADGMMYHDALCTTAARLGMTVELIERGAEAARAAESRGVRLADVEQLLDAAGESLGAPWRQEHRAAAAAAMAVLAGYTAARPSSRRALPS